MNCEIANEWVFSFINDDSEIQIVFNQVMWQSEFESDKMKLRGGKKPSHKLKRYEISNSNRSDHVVEIEFQTVWNLKYVEIREWILWLIHEIVRVYDEMKGKNCLLILHSIMGDQVYLNCPSSNDNDEDADNIAVYIFNNFNTNNLSAHLQ